MVAGALLAVALAAGCSDDDDGAEPTSYCAPLVASCEGPAPSFSAEVMPILSVRCNTCHDPTRPDAPWAFESYSHVVAWQSEITSDLAACSMPPRAADLLEDERATLGLWLACGAPDN